MPRHGSGSKKLQSSPFRLVVGTLTGSTVSGICYESICPSSKTRNSGVKKWCSRILSKPNRQLHRLGEKE